MRAALLIASLAACAHAQQSSYATNPDVVCRPPESIAGQEPSLCWWRESGGEAWCTYGGPGWCDGTRVRPDCDAEWEQAWAECTLPSMPAAEDGV